jgi:hypothetical protein
MSQKPQLFRKMSSVKYYQLFIVMLLSSVSLLNAQDILLGQYEFLTGDNQLKPSVVTSGLTFSDVMIENDGLTVEYIDNTLVTSAWPASLSTHPGAKCVQFAISKGSFLSEYNVYKIVLYYKATGAKHRIDAYFGDAVNPVNLACKRTGQNAVDFVITEMDEGRNSNGVLFPAITDDAQTYYAIAFQQPTEADQVTFNKIEVWGTATPAASAVTVDVLSKAINSTYGHPLTFPVKVSGLTASQDVTLSITGENAGMFSVDKSTLTASELNAGDQTVQVTYQSTVRTLNLESNAHFQHQAVLKLQSAEIPTIEIPIYASCHVLYEDFAAYDSVKPNTAEGVPPVFTDFPVIPGNEMQTGINGWSGDYLYAYVTGKTFGSVNMASSATDSAYLVSPAVDLSQPFNVTVTFRSFDKGTDGRFFIYLDDQLMFSDVNTTNSIKTVTTETYVGTASSKIKFTGFKADGNQIIVDDIMVNYSSQSPVNETGLLDVPDGSVKIHPNGIELMGYEGMRVEVYAISGVKISERIRLADHDFIALGDKGCYIVKIQDGMNQFAKKIIIQ